MIGVYEAPANGPIIKSTAQQRWEKAHEAWDAFYQRDTAVWELPKPEPPKPKAQATNHVPTWKESQEILKGLLDSGKLKTSR